ncbi:uncharacterized protein NPIL_673531 [Nephila pilipes]|uniref:Uncharacterized protein n=1 Tax=Nephila pilipes TaxID=299642 RepID=A0A8X6ISZ1_NEPPI|nr:uncharacterized protein NPIL_673531 [Nephila pilipes]
MDVTQLKTQRKSFRISFTVCANKIDAELTKEIPNVKQLSILKSQIGDKFAHLKTCQRDITDLILKGDDANNIYKEDFQSAENYRDQYCELKTGNIMDKPTGLPETRIIEKRPSKLPRIELKRFNVDAKEYLAFWS